MKKSGWISISVFAGAVALFLALDGPSEIYSSLNRPKLRSRHFVSENQWTEDPAISAVAAKITAFTIRRGGCFGECPIYTFRIAQNGAAIYEGIDFVPKKGRYTGKGYGFDDLAYFAAARLLSLKDNYEIPVTDHSGTVLIIQMNDGIKRISDYARAGPNDLHIFCTALDRVQSSIEWTREPSHIDSREEEPATNIPLADRKARSGKHSHNVNP